VLEAALHAEGAALRLAYRVRRRAAPDADGVLAFDEADAVDIPRDGLRVARIELDLASDRHALIRHLRRALRPDADEVRDARETDLHALLESLTRAEQHGQHEDAPEHAERRQHRAQLVPRQR